MIAQGANDLCMLHPGLVAAVAAAVSAPPVVPHDTGLG
jgi:hypothetical protein